MKIVCSYERCCSLFLLFLVPFAVNVAFGESEIARITTPWQPQRAHAIGDGLLFTQTFVYPFTEVGMGSPYLMTTTPIVYCGNDETLIPVLDDMPRGVSILSVDANMAHVVGGIFIEQESEHQGRIYPTRLYTSSDGVNWATLPDAPDIMWKMPFHLFEAHGCLFLECTTGDMKDFIAQYGITLAPGLLVDPAFIQGVLQDINMMPTVYRSCDGGVSWTEMSDIPWHTLELSSIPQYHLNFNGAHFARAVTDINNPFLAQSYLFRSDDGLVWQHQDIVADALNQQVSGIAISQNAFYALAVDSEMPLYYPSYYSGGPTVWKSMNGVDWAAHSLQVPVASAMTASDHLLVVGHLDVENWIMKSPGIYFSRDGAYWFLWRDWPGDYDESNCWAIPLVLTEDALYAAIGLRLDEEPWETSELWRVPLTLFTDGPPRVTISRALHQPAQASAFPVVFDIAWSKPVYGFSADAILLDGFYFILAESPEKEGGTHYTLTVTGSASGTREGTIAPAIPAGAAVDASSNPSEEALCINATVLLQLPPEMPMHRYYIGFALIILLAAAGGIQIRQRHLISGN